MVTFNALVQIFGRFFQEGGSAILKEMIEYTETKCVTEDGEIFYKRKRLILVYKSPTR
jgi:hypothetical protein